MQWLHPAEHNTYLTYWWDIHVYRGWHLIFWAFIPASELSVCLFLTRLKLSILKHQPRVLQYPDYIPGRILDLSLCFAVTVPSDVLDAWASKWTWQVWGARGWVCICGGKWKARGWIVAAFCPYFLIFWTKTCKSTIAEVWLFIFIISDYSSMLREPFFHEVILICYYLNTIKWYENVRFQCYVKKKLPRTS